MFTPHRTLQFRLNLAFTLLSLLVAVAAGGWTFYDIYRETNDFQDDLLKFRKCRLELRYRWVFGGGWRCVAPNQFFCV